MALKFDVAIRDYIAQHVRPVMYKMVGKDDFMPETMSTSFVARTIFEDVRKEFPDYIIKFSSDNPRNPANKAGSEELKIIDYFNDNPQSQRWEGKISINDKPYFAKFRAMRMQAACLGCHGDPENAPASLLKRYGSTAGFHRPLGKVIGMDTIAIPIVKITEHLWPKSMQAFFLIALGLLLFFLSIIYLTRFIVTKRLSSITEHFLTAAQQSNYQEITPIEIEGNDEIRDLAVSFNSLCDRLKNFYSSLETKVKDRTQELSDKNEQMKQEIEERKHAEEALKASETFLKTLINAIPFPIFYKDRNGRYLGFNRAFEAFSGEPRKRLIGKTVFDINTPELAEIYHAKDNDLFESGGVQQYESQAENAHGVMRDVIFNKALFFDNQKSVGGLIGIIIDITERKQVAEDLRKSELKYKTLIDNINSGVAVYEATNDGEDFIFVDINKAGEKIENIRREDLIGNSVLDVFPGIKDFGLFDVFKKVWKTGKPEYFPIALYKDERISGWKDNYVYKLPSGEIIAVYHDKTEQKKSEDALRVSEEKFRNLFNNAEVGMFRTRIDGSDILEMNEKFLDIFGRTREEMQGSPSVIHWADPSEREEMLRRLELEGHVPEFECRMLNKQGEVRSCLTSLRLYREQRILEGSIIDITERKQAEEALQASEKFLETLINAIPIPVFYKDKNGRYLGFNKAFETFCGEPMEGLIGKTVFDINPPELAKIYQNKDDELFESEGVQQYKSQVKNAHGELRDVIFNKAVFTVNQETLGGLIGAILDITEIKRKDEALQCSEEKYRELIENLNDLIYIVDLNGTIIYVSPPIESVLGYTFSDLAGKNYEHLVHPDHLDAIRQVFKDVLQNRIYPTNFRIRTKSGEYRWVRASNRPIHEGNQVKGIQGVLTDIDEQKRAEEALRESERILDATGKKGKIGGWEHDLTTGKALWTQALYDIIEIPYDQLPPSVDEHLGYYPPEDRKILEQAYDQAVDQGIPFNLELQVYTSKKKLHWCRVQGEPMLENGKCVKMRGTFQDITDFKLAEKEKQTLEGQLQQSQKMEAIGLLAGGIAHDFNNLLTTIIGYSDFVQDQVRENPSLYGEIEEIRKAGRKAAALTRQLLAFSRKQLIRPEILNLNDILTDTEKMFRRTIGEDIEFKTMFEPELWKVKVDPGQIEQILLNLVVNARDAMPTGGKLTIETANVELDDAYFQKYGVKDKRGSYVLLSVADSGIGMDEETLSRIFEPFFTTKERDQGTGLGLSTVYGIVKQNNGHIRADSEPGKGTTFKVYFQRIKTDEVSDDIEEQLDENQLKGSETILIAEDSETLLKLTQKMLESYGYKSLTSQNGHEAMEIFKGHDGPIHLLLTDVVMPDMNGRELAEQIQSESPKVQVLYMSGYTDDTISKHGVLYDDVEFIEKPFSTKDLGLKVREVLNQGIDDL